MNACLPSLKPRRRLASMSGHRAKSTALLAGKRGKKGDNLRACCKALKLKSAVIKGGGGLGNIDFLATRKMTVMPPSIHPDTGKPYETLGQALLAVDFAGLPEFDERHLNLLKATIGSEYAIVMKRDARRRCRAYWRTGTRRSDGR